MADQYYIDSRATGANNGSKNDGTTNAAGIVIDAWQSISDITGILANDGPDINFGNGSGVYSAPETFLAGNNINWYGNGIEITGGVDVNTVGGWTASGTAGEWYMNTALSVEPKCGTVAGHYQGSSAEVGRQMGTPGALTFNNQFGWGDADLIGESRLYVKSTVDPTTLVIKMAQQDYNVKEAWLGNKFHSIIFSYANIANVSCHEDYELYKCAFLYPDFVCVSVPFTRNNQIIEGCIGYWGGHRFIFMENVDCNAVVRNCIAYESHLFALFSTACDATTSLTIENCIQVGGEAGAIDKKSATAILVENNNCWYPRMTAANGALGYVSQANWPTTHSTDIPSSHATSESSQSNLIDPLFSISDDEFIPADFELIKNSPVLGAGVKWWSGANRVGYNGEPFADFETDIGSSQSTHNASHPTKL